MKLKHVNEDNYQVWDQDETKILHEGTMKQCDDFMHEEIKKKVEADPEWIINQLKAFSQQMKVFKKMIEDQEQKIKTQTNDSKNDTTGESSIS